MRRILLSLLTVICFASIAKGQSVQKVEDKILYYTAHINKWDTTYGHDDKFDSLGIYNKLLLDYLAKVLVNKPATLEYDFPRLKDEGMGILTSDDKKFRIYYWDVGRGAGSRSCNVLVQYKSIRGTQVKVLSDVSKMDEFEVSSGLFYSDVYTIKTKTDKAMYMALGAQKIAAGLFIKDLQAFTINNNTLNDSIKIFKTTKELLNNIGYSFEATLVGDNDPSIKVSDDKQKIYIPVVTDEGRVTSKHLVYVFDGNNYVFDKNAK